MHRRSVLRRTILAVLGILLVLCLVLLTALTVVHGPVAVYRLVSSRFDTRIDDFLRYPGRPLRASDSPLPLDVSGRELEIPAPVLAEYGHGGQLDTILEANDSIAFLVIQGDTVVFERYFQGHTASSPSQAFSMSKSFTSALIGMAIDDGILGGVDQPITDLVPELSPAGFDVVRVHDLLNMTSGSSYMENDNPFGEHVTLNFTDRLEREILTFTMERPPGTLFRYKTGDNALLALALSRALAPETITAYAQRRLWTPLGMQDDGMWTIDHDGDGLEKSWCCLAASARDFAKLGRLYLRGGEVNGQQVLSAEWIEQSTQVGQVPESAWPQEYTDTGWWNYGYQWWLASENTGDYFALGKDGQFLYVNPQKDLIIVRLGWSLGELTSGRWIRLFQTIAEQSG
jgi:CubicO group peptidase (beta-lactamase class C family)